MANRRQTICIYTIIDTLRIPFEGDMRSDRDVLNFIHKHYDKACKVRNQIRELQDLVDNFTLQMGIEMDVEEKSQKINNYGNK